MANKNSKEKDNKLLKKLLRKKSKNYTPYQDWNRRGDEFTFPELKAADEYLRRTSPPSRRTRQMNPGAEKDAFGERLKDSEFRKQLRKLQEKHRITGYV